jgi:4-hydroxy-tetrahydrodipicolinate synthase
VQSRDYSTALEHHNELLGVWNAINGDNLPANVKYAMELQGRPAGYPRAPMPAPSARRKDSIRRALGDLM